MEASMSSTSLFKGSTIGLHRGGLSRSSPSLVTAAAFNLRDFSQSRKKIGYGERPESAGTSALRLKREHLEEIDLIGGNGRWRQRKAETEFDRRRMEEEAKRAEEEKRQKKTQQRQQMKEARQRKQQKEEEKQRIENEDKRRIAREEREAAKLAEEEERRKYEVEEERQRIMRLPKTCQTCTGGGHCQVCGGAGHVYAMYLVTEVKTHAPSQDYGKLIQGCTHCGGYRQGIRGDLLKGSGKCPPCGGMGKIWPDIDGKEKSTHLRRRGHISDISTVGAAEMGAMIHLTKTVGLA